MGGFTGWPRGLQPALACFSVKFCILLKTIFSKINRISTADRCPGHPFLNFLDLPL